MTPEKLEQLKPYTDFLINFVNDLLAVLMVEGISAEFQQVVKVFTMGLLLMLFLGLVSFLIKFIGSVLRPVAEGLGQKPEYVMYVIFAVLILFFTTKVTFPAAVLVLFLFVLADFGAKYYLKVGFGSRSETVEVQVEDESEEAGEGQLIAELKAEAPPTSSAIHEASKAAGEGK